MGTHPCVFEIGILRSLEDKPLRRGNETWGGYSLHKHRTTFQTLPNLVYLCFIESLFCQFFEQKQQCLFKKFNFFFRFLVSFSKFFLPWIQFPENYTRGWNASWDYTRGGYIRGFTLQWTKTLTSTNLARRFDNSLIAIEKTKF